MQCVDLQQRKGICCIFDGCPIVQQEYTRGVNPSFCGFYGREPLVCCPYEPLVTYTTTPLPHQPTDLHYLPPGRLNVTGPTQTVTTPPTETPYSFGERGGRAKYWCSVYSKTCPDFDNFGGLDIRVLNGGGESIEDAGGEVEIGISKNKLGVENGKYILPNEYPHTAVIGYGPGNNIVWKCGGSLISERFVLTSAHCLHGGRDGAAKWVLLGIVNITAKEYLSGEKGQIHEVVQRISHPGYRQSEKYHDIALIQIGPAVTRNAQPLLSEGLHPACLSTNEPQGHFRFINYIATEWGFHVPQHEEPSLHLLKAPLNLIGDSTCDEIYARGHEGAPQLTRGVDRSLLCAAVVIGDTSTCGGMIKGETSGSLQIIKVGDCQYEVWGIKSFGKTCGLPNSPAVYTKVSSYIEWIEDHVWPMRK